MRFLRNIQPFVPVAMTGMVRHSGPQIASKALVNDRQKEIRFFSYAKGEDIDKEDPHEKFRAIWTGIREQAEY
ncbi:hypothetical protein [Anaerotalea alkaliphila]|uniref:Uncharacterized protein n=1 Tax=Anaerotalea alkaliphila TaxID=2662126 RepID=A0A7X5HUL8_9FIRM|nr:hypothetical protein [Anaerotalea alkaliphila]NDL66996.1 hypothetical protein [Anaerotalea alkaliphila]